MKKIISFLIILILISGCGVTSQLIQSVSSIYLPFAAGHKWNFRDVDRSWSVEVLGTQTLGGMTVYQLSSLYPGDSQMPEPFPHPYVYFSDRALRFTSQPNLTDLSYFVDVIKVPLVLGDSYVNTAGTWTVESLSDTVTVAAGTFTNCARLKIVPLVNPSTETHYFYLAPNVGLVKSYNPHQGHLIELVSYTVG